MSLSPIQILSLTQLAGARDGPLALVHDRPEYLIVWVTRGQGRLLLNGTRRGVGTHNALAIPPGSLFALDIGRQGMGHVALIPDGTDIRLPEEPRQLRVRDATAISEMTGIFEAAQREASHAWPLSQDALDAHVALMSVWLRRQLTTPEQLPKRKTTAERLSAAFCAQVSLRYSQGLSIAEHADALDVSAAHLSRACKTSTGRTASELLTERVLYAARQALQETRVPIQDIARHLGFGSAAYFTRFIQQHTSMTPTAVRKTRARSISTLRL